MYICRQWRGVAWPGLVRRRHSSPLQSFRVRARSSPEQSSQGEGSGRRCPARRRRSAGALCLCLLLLLLLLLAIAGLVPCGWAAAALSLEITGCRRRCALLPTCRTCSRVSAGVEYSSCHGEGREGGREEERPRTRAVPSCHWPPILTGHGTAGDMHAMPSPSPRVRLRSVFAAARAAVSLVSSCVCPLRLRLSRVAWPGLLFLHFFFYPIRSLSRSLQIGCEPSGACTPP